MPEVLWYYAKNDEQLGPVSPAELKQLATSRALLPEDLIWREGMDGWAPASKVKGLFADVREAVAAPPPNNGLIDTVPPVATTISAPPADVTPPPPPASSGVPADIFAPPIITLPPLEVSRVIARPSVAPSEEANGGAVDLLWWAQVLLWGICIASVFVGGVLFTSTLIKSESATDEAASAIVFLTFFLATYLVARSGEHVAALLQTYFDRKRKP